MRSTNVQLFSKSVMNKVGVVLLNPCFSSSTNVWYTESSVLMRDKDRNSIPANASDCVILYQCQHRIGWPSDAMGLTSYSLP